MFDWDDVPEDLGGVVDAKLSYEIGGVALAAAEGNEASPLVPSVPPLRGIAAEEISPGDLEALRWMMQKANMRQDMFLLGPPGPLLRRVVLQFCKLFKREMEYVGITRDTNEADLKQRREIRDGHVVYVDQPPVRAALHGRVLVLEGMEKAERNVLPLLNNLLENREMALEDRRFLMSPERAQQLKAERYDQADWINHILPVHQDFIVIAIGLPNRGNPLDPPLRSRFCAFSLCPPAPVEVLRPISQMLPSVLAALVERLCEAVHALKANSQVPIFPHGGINGAAMLFRTLPDLDPMAVFRRIYPYDQLCLGKQQLQVIEEAAKIIPTGKTNVEYALKELTVGDGRRAVLKFTYSNKDAAEVQCPAGKWVAVSPALKSADQAHGNDVSHQNDELAQVKKLTVKELKAWLTARKLKHDDCFEKSDMVSRAQEYLASVIKTHSCPQGPMAASFAGIKLVGSQARNLVAILGDHAAGMDVCLIGEKGVGKSALIRAFSSLLGYRCRVVFCYKDMISRDLLQRRITDPRGNTKWHDSSLIEAAVNGDLAVLDGVHRLAKGVLYSALGAFLADREVVLPDGSRLIATARWHEVLDRRGLCHDCKEFDADGVRYRVVHPAFRCVATGEPPVKVGAPVSNSWLDDEVMTLFHFHQIKQLSAEEQVSLLTESGADSQVLQGLLMYSSRIAKAARDDVNLEPLQLSLRVLLRISLHLQRRTNDISGALNRAFSAYLRFLPTSSQEAVDSVLMAAMKDAGVKAQGLQRQRVMGPSKEQTRTRRQDLRMLENTAIQARMYGFGEEEVDNAREKADQDREDQRTQRLAALRKKAISAVQKPPPEGTYIKEGILHINDASCNIRAPRHPELVPDVSFVSIPNHVEALRDMLLDWSLGHNLLLVGNQGVGKNKLADRLLCLLRCEREYVQLHRDTTVQSLTLAPTLQAGVVVWEDSPLVRAVREGRCLVVDEADKAPLEVVCVLKALCEDGELTLLDGRTIVRRDDPRLTAAAGTPEEAEFISTAPGFRMIVLANRPGYPFMGNDFFRVCGDVFSCHTIDNPDIESEVALLRSVGPNVPQARIVQLALLFTELRDLVELGQLSYPYSLRELVKLVTHAENFPSDPLEEVASSVFAFDLVDGQKRLPLLEVLKRHGIATTAAGEAMLEGRYHGDMNLRLDENRDKSKDVTKEDNADGTNPPEMAEGGPKHGEWDGAQHTGGNMFAGGSGGTGTAGLGGRWGPYRLDVGQKLVMVPEELKQGVDEATKKKAQKMADEAYKKRLDEMKMTLQDGDAYSKLRSSVAIQIQEMKICLEGQEARERERQWLKNQTHGELDDNRLVDGITGSKTIYTRRGEPDNDVFGTSQSQPKRITFVMDISGSMYTFNRIDRRLQRLQELAIFIFESFSGFEAKYDYRMVGHSGTSAEAERLVEWGRPPHRQKDRLEIAKRMEAHAQFCHPGDHTLEGTQRAIDEIAKKPADERFVFIISDADLQRYNIDVRQWGKILMKNPSVKAYVIMISNNVDEAERIKATLAPGRGLICAETASLAVTFKQIFKDSMLRG